MSIDPDLVPIVDRSLAPRGPSMLLQVVRELDLPPDSVALDVGCGSGTHAFRLATHFGLQVLGIDPVQRNLDLAREARRDEPEEIASRVTFGRGSACDLPAADSSADLVWCRDVLVHVSSLDDAYAEFARVLRPGGRAVIHQLVATPLLAAAEAAWLFRALGLVASSMDPAATDAAVLRAGLRVDASLDLGSEWGEHDEEESGRAGRALLRAARLQREPDHYRAAMGAAAYDVTLADSLWQVYRMLGKLSGRILVLTRP
ncbi:class I SAM-dependent methyltransferase [Nocardioides sp.]|uniref:class I SAM-dependent methyltransferase n=1 Tax=Nocardioides sp. TaxID=35761 RepID=UPI00286E50BB|nr:class I SAM-dependent methyltransferase [Nocardioides sp.]